MIHSQLRIKTTKEQEEEQKIKDRERSFHFRDLTQQLFKLRPTIGVDNNIDEIFKLSNEILLIEPDFYTVWNIRKETLLIYNHENDESIWKNELSFTRECLKKNEKSYSVWQHRIWILSKMSHSEYNGEIELCNNFLMKDERNFHCWDYRSYISDVMGADIEKELEFTTDKIRNNFSNFSAWHRRHKLFLKGLQMDQADLPRSCNLLLVWNQEYEMILNALYTDPNDQSPWLYHNWLIKNNLGQLSKDHIEKLKTLEELEPDNRWVKQALELAISNLK